jgi:hypothetical protein
MSKGVRILCLVIAAMMLLGTVISIFVSVL